MRWNRLILLIAGIVIGVCAICAPNFISALYGRISPSQIGIADVLVRTGSILVGLLVIYNALKTSLKD